MNEISRGDRGGVRRRFVLAAMVTGIIVLAACGSGASARTYLFWADGAGVIGRAAINGTGVSERFITGASRPVGVAVSSRYIYWTNPSTGTIGRANLDGSAADQRFITVQTGRPLGVTLIPGS
jgi:hypothetical protein